MKSGIVRKLINKFKHIIIFEWCFQQVTFPGWWYFWGLFVIGNKGKIAVCSLPLHAPEWVPILSWWSRIHCFAKQEKSHLGKIVTLHRCIAARVLINQSVIYTIDWHPTFVVQPSNVDLRLGQPALWKKRENVRDIFELPGLWNEFRGFWRFLFDSHIGPPENRPSLVQRIEETTTNLISSPPGLGPSNKNELQKLEDVLAKWMLRGWICSNKSFLHIQRSQLHLSHTSSVSHLTFPVQVMKDICTLQHPRLSYLLRRDISGLFSYLIFTHLNYLGVFLCPFLYERFCRLHGHPILSVNALQTKTISIQNLRQRFEE